MLLQDRVIAPELLARRMAELIPEYLPGMDTGAAEPSDRRICWNNTLKALLSAIAAENEVKVEIHPASHLPKDEQPGLHWRRGYGPVFPSSTGWGDRDSL